MEKEIKKYLKKLSNLFPNEYFSISSEIRIYSNGEIDSEFTLTRLKDNKTSFIIFFKDFDGMKNTIKFILGEPILCCEEPGKKETINDNIDPNE